MSTDTTLAFFEDAPQSRQAVNTGVDLIAYDAWGRPQTYPLLYDRWYIGVPAEGFQPDLVLEDCGDPRARVVLKWLEGQLFLSNESPQLQVLVNQQLSLQRELFDGDRVSLGQQLFQVVGLRTPLATLEGYTPPHRGQRWLLEAGRNTLGRKGQRLNQVELDDPTVSRSHATLVVTEFGASLEAEARSSQSKVNGQPLSVGQPQELKDSDLLQLGRQLFRLRLSAGHRPQARGPSSEVAVLCLQTQSPEGYPAYLQFFKWLWQQPRPETVHSLPFDGQTLVFASLGRDRVDALIDYAWHLRRYWKGQLKLRLALHSQTADQQPPQLRFASLKRCLEVALSLLPLAQDSALTLSRAAWEVSQKVTTTQRLGRTQILGDEVPIEAYSVEMF